MLPGAVTRGGRTRERRHVRVRRLPLRAGRRILAEMAADEALAVLVEITSAGDVEPARLEELTASLRRELNELEVESVEPAPGGAPPAGTKVGEVLALGALVVTVAKSAGSVLAVVRALQEWASRGGRTVKLDIGGDAIELTGASREQQDRLIAAWVERQGVS
jgi:hypothetical protein